MNRSQRRAAERRNLKAGVKAIAAEMRGTLRVTTVRPADYFGMLADLAVGGCTEHLGLLRNVAEVVERVRKAPAAEPMLCAACPNPLTGGFAVVVAHAARITPKTGLSLGVCTSCGTDIESIEAAALKGLRGIWPDLKPLPVHHQAGHA